MGINFYLGNECVWWDSVRIFAKYCKQAICFQLFNNFNKNGGKNFVICIFVFNLLKLIHCKFQQSAQPTFVKYLEHHRVQTELINLLQFLKVKYYLITLGYLSKTSLITERKARKPAGSFGWKLWWNEADRKLVGGALWERFQDEDPEAWVLENGTWKGQESAGKTVKLKCFSYCKFTFYDMQFICLHLSLFNYVTRFYIQFFE